MCPRPTEASGWSTPVQVEAVRRADQRRRWHEVGRVLFATEPRWSPPLRAYETWLVDRRHPYRQATGAELERWLVRRRGNVVGRIAAHHVGADETAWFGGFECADDAAAVAALVDAVVEWASARGASRVAGPALYLPEDGDAGVLTAGFEHRGGTGRPWHPPWYADHLAAAGLTPCRDPMPRWRLLTGGRAAADLPRGALPPHAGRLGDADLAFDRIAAVPDVTAAARTTSLRRLPAPTEAAVVLCDGDPAALVPALLAAAGAKHYQAVWAPWSPDRGRPPDTVHRLFEMVADRNRLT